MAEVADARKAFETAKQQRWQSLCSTYPDGPEGYRYVMERCQKVGQRKKRGETSARSPVKKTKKKTNDASKKSIRKLLKKTRKEHASRKLKALESRRARLSTNGPSVLDPKAKIVVDALVDVVEESPKFIEFVFRRFIDPKMVAQEPDPERRYKRAVSYWKGLPELAESINIKSHVLSMALNI